MNEQQIIEFAKENDLCWSGLKRRHPEVAEWIEDHIKDVGLLLDIGDVLIDIGNLQSIMLNGRVLRLRPDYELPNATLHLPTEAQRKEVR